MHGNIVDLTVTSNKKTRSQRARQAVLDSKKNTPRTQMRTLLRHLHVPDRVRKTLVFHHALTDDLKITHRQAKSERTPAVFQNSDGKNRHAVPHAATGSERIRIF